MIGIDLTGMRVLLVGPNRHRRSLLTSMLRGLGFAEVFSVDDGQRALAELRYVPVDLIIADHRMLPIDGLEFTRRLRKADDQPDTEIPVILVGTEIDEDTVLHAKSVGVSSFVLQPVAPRTLGQRIEAALRRRPLTYEYAKPGSKPGLDLEAVFLEDDDPEPPNRAALF